MESGVKLGVSSRGSGNVNDSGIVKDFEIITVDIVANPSARCPFDPNYERIMNHRRGNVLMDVWMQLDTTKKHNVIPQEEVTNFIKNRDIGEINMVRNG